MLDFLAPPGNESEWKLVAIFGDKASHRGSNHIPCVSSLHSVCSVSNSCRDTPTGALQAILCHSIALLERDDVITEQLGASDVCSCKRKMSRVTQGFCGRGWAIFSICHSPRYDDLPFQGVKSSDWLRITNSRLTKVFTASIDAYEPIECVGVSLICRALTDAVIHM